MIAQRLGLGLAIASLLAYAREGVAAPRWTAPLCWLVVAAALYGARFSGRRPSRWAGVLVAAAAIAAFAGAWHAASAWPHGAWDAVELWNHRALSLARGSLSQMFESATRHADYPLLLPLTVAPLWELSESIPGATLVAALFGLLTALLLFEGVSARSGADAAAVATALLLATPLYATHALSQRADVPLAFYTLGAVIALDRREWIGLGLALGAAAWTKNEGLVWAAAGLMAAGWVGRRDSWRTFAAFAPFALAVAVHRSLSGPGDIEGGKFVAERVPTVAWAFANATALYLGLGAALAWALAARSRLRHETLAAAAVVGAALVGYAGVYTMTPHDLAWHLDSSLDRILLHAWPATLYLVGSRQ